MIKKLLIGLSVSIALLFGTVSTFAADGFGVGVALSGAKIEASGTETEGGETNNGKADNFLPIGSVFAEYTKGLFTIGIDYIPFDADISDATKTRTDTETSVTSTATHTTTSRTQKAQAEITDHTTAYIEIGSTAYVKAGLVQVTVNTQESLGTGSAYGNIDLDGTLLGVGLKGDWGDNLFYKLEGTYTDYDTLNLTSTQARTGVSTNNKIKADLDVTQIKLGLGMKF